MGKEADKRKIARNLERKKLFAAFSACIKEAIAEIGIEMKEKGKRVVKESTQTKQVRLRVYWRKVNRRARKIYGKPAPRGYYSLKGNPWIGE